MIKTQIGIIGISSMGANLVLNLIKNNFYVSIFNRSSIKTKKFIKKNNNNKIIPFYSLNNFINSLQKPRIIFLLIKSGKPIDNILNILVKILETNDILIDCGNSYYKDTIKRNIYLSKYKINFIGMGISGGYKGALKGASLMPGGSKKIYNIIYPILKKITAYTKSGTPCVTYIGKNGSGHYVKMIHNGIEYGDMQLISEVYSILKNIIKLNNYQISKILNKWNKGELNSYLIKITCNILKTKENNSFLIDLISDETINKGTAKWMIKDSLILNEPLTLISQSLFFRYLSKMKKQRIIASKILQGPEINKKIKNKLFLIEELRKSLYFGRIICYSQSLSQLQSASKKYNWNLKYHNIIKIFREGSIIKSKILQKILETYLKYKNITNLLITPYFINIVNSYNTSIRFIIKYAISYGIPIPGFLSVISYYDTYRSKYLTSNLIQAQRDYFGKHTYKKINKKKNYTGKWYKQ